MKCACCSEKEADDCCMLFLVGDKFPETPEELMRSLLGVFAGECRLHW